MQVPGAGNFRLEDPLETLPGLLQKDAVVQDAGGVHDSPEWRRVVAEVGQHIGHAGNFGNVRGDDAHVRAGRLQLAQSALRRRLQAVAPQKHQVSGSALHKPLCHRQTQTAQAAGDQVGPICPKPSVRGCR